MKLIRFGQWCRGKPFGTSGLGFRKRSLEVLSWHGDKTARPFAVGALVLPPHLRQAPGPVRRDTTLGTVWLFFNCTRGVNRRVCKTGLESWAGAAKPVILGARNDSSAPYRARCYPGSNWRSIPTHRDEAAMNGAPGVISEVLESAIFLSPLIHPPK
jgi:hypothetical protein